MLIVAAGMVAASPLVQAGPDPYLMAHALVAAPFLVAGIALSRHALHQCPPAYHVFWRRWIAAGVTGILATAAAIATVVFQERAFLMLDMAMLAAGVPFWASAAYHANRVHAGRSSITVDLADAVTAVLVLGTPGLLLFAQPVGQAEDLALVLPFALTAVLSPALLYLSLVNLTRMPRGERVTQGIGIGVAAAAAVNVTLQLAYVAGDIALPLPLVLTVHVTNMMLIGWLPLWARRRVVPQQPLESAVRLRNPMPYVSAVVLPLLGAYLVVEGADTSWEIMVFCLVLLVVIVLNAARYTAMSRETRRLSDGLAQMAEERRHLLARLLRGLENDRQRTATELHSQALGSLATLGSIVQTAQATLPTDTATHVREAIGEIQRDLGDRAEALRQLMVAMRDPVAGHPAVDAERPDDDTLVAALQAFTSELYGGRLAPQISIQVDPELRLDWSTAAIAYRIAQEALLDTACDPTVTTAGVTVSRSGRGVLLEVRDDGTGFRSGQASISRQTRMEMFAYLGGGELTVGRAPGGGRIARSRLGPREEQVERPRQPKPRPRRHLHLVTTPGTER